jgi:hypothetical protein
MVNKVGAQPSSFVIQSKLSSMDETRSGHFRPGFIQRPDGRNFLSQPPSKPLKLNDVFSIQSLLL